MAHHHYTKTAKVLHWGIATIWLGVWCLGILAVYARDWLNPNHGLTTLHKALAITLVVLVPLRIIWRLTHPAPNLPDSISPLMQKAAKLGHLAIYVAALVALPLSGWFWSSVVDRPILFLGLWQMPMLTAPNPDLSDVAKWLHIGLAWFCGAMIVGHILMALKHKFIDNDGVFESMWPGK